MLNLLHKTRQFLVSEDGPTAVEYAVMLALIIVVCLVSIQLIGTNANLTFNSVANVLPGASYSLPLQTTRHFWALRHQAEAPEARAGERINDQVSERKPCCPSFPAKS